MLLVPKCWCGNVLVSEDREVATVHQCRRPQVGSDRHAVIIELPARLASNLNGQLDEFYQQLEVSPRHRIPPDVIREVGIIEIWPHVNRPCLQPGCGGQMCPCVTAQDLAWVGSCGHVVPINGHSSKGF